MLLLISMLIIQLFMPAAIPMISLKKLKISIVCKLVCEVRRTDHCLLSRFLMARILKLLAKLLQRFL